MTGECFLVAQTPIQDIVVSKNCVRELPTCVDTQSILLTDRLVET